MAIEIMEINFWRVSVLAVLLSVMLITVNPGIMTFAAETASDSSVETSVDGAESIDNQTVEPEEQNDEGGPEEPAEGDGSEQIEEQTGDKIDDRTDDQDEGKSADQFIDERSQEPEASADEGSEEEFVDPSSEKDTPAEELAEESADPSLETEAPAEETLSRYAAVCEGTLPDGVSIKGLSAMLESDNTLRLYFDFKDVDPNNLTFAIDKKDGDDDKNNVELRQRSDGLYYITLGEGVYSNHLQDTHTYSVSDGTNTYTITASVLTYAKTCIKQGNENESNLGKALYLYNRAAIEEFGE